MMLDRSRYSFLVLALQGIGLSAATVAAGEVSAPAVPKAFSGVRPSFGATFDPVIDSGKKVYLRFCVGCHGDKGDGAGPAARFLDPKPRDFTKGVFKFGTVAAGKLPRDEDLMRTITNGLSATSMSAWRLLPHEMRWAVVQYIKTFSTRWKRDKPGNELGLPEDPFNEESPSKWPEIRALGENVYHGLATCWSCHPSYVPNEKVAGYVAAAGGSATPRADMHKSEGKMDSAGWGLFIMPPDFTVRRLKTGHSLEVLARVISNGIGGTAMPTWKGRLKDEEFWSLVYYVRGLVDRRIAKEKSAIPLPTTPQAADR